MTGHPPAHSLFTLTRRELVLLVLMFLASLPAVTTRIYSSDEIEYFSYLRSIWFDHDVSFENEYQYFHDRNIARAEGFHETFLERVTEAGRRPNFGTIGSALLWSPFYAVADVSVRLRRAAGSSVAADGFSQPYIAAVAYGSALYGFLAVLLTIGAARRVLPASAKASARPGFAGGTVRPPAETTNDSSLFGSLVVWAGSPLLFYMYVAPPMSHACSAFAVALFVTVWLYVRQDWSVRGVIALGMSAGLMAMVREQDAFFAIGPALDFVLHGRRGQSIGAIARMTVAGCAATVLTMAPQFAAYQGLNGHMTPSRLVARKMTWTAPHALEVLFSPAHGFVFWTPLAVLAVAGLGWLAVRSTGERRDVARLALLMIALQIYVGGSVESWTVAGAFGQRRFVALTALLGIGLAALWDAARATPWRPVLTVAIVVCLWWNLALMALFGTGLMNRQRLELGRNAYDAFVTVPRLAPQLAYRYVFDRQSYYRTAPPAQVP
ncbi:MAG: hypothetical protein ABIX28_17090 [Vicinamibacterales bacterium]